MTATYLVLGGSGLLGRQLAKQLAERGDSVAVFDVVQRYDDISFHKGDITDEERVFSVIKQVSPDCVFHTVTPTGFVVETNEALQWKVNVDGTKYVIAACIKAGVKRLVYTSSAGIIFDGNPLNGVDETYPINYQGGFGAYHLAKAFAEKEVLEANGRDGLLTCALRPVTIFGPGERLAMPSFFRQFQEGKTNIQIGDNTNLVDWVSARNLADAHILAAEGLLSPLIPDEPVAGQAFVITNDEPWLFWDFPNAVYKKLDEWYPSKRKPNQNPWVLPAWVGLILGAILELHGWIVGRKPVLTRIVVRLSVMPRWFDISKAKRVLGYKPRIGLDEEIESMVEWYVKEEFKDDQSTKRR